jgi:hypothetical protein
MHLFVLQSLLKRFEDIFHIVAEVYIVDVSFLHSFVKSVFYGDSFEESARVEFFIDGLPIF